MTVFPHPPSPATPPLSPAETTVLEPGARAARQQMTARIWAHIEALCGQFGARPAASDAERGAAGYIKGQLHGFGVRDVREQRFDAPPSPGVLAALALAAGVFGVRTAARGGRLSRLAGAALLLAAGHTLREIIGGALPTAARPLALARALIPDQAERGGLSLGALGALPGLGRSQNIIARIPAAGAARGLVYVVAHIDTSKQRFLMPHLVPAVTRPFNTALLGLGLVGGLSLVWSALRGRPGLPAAARAAGAASMGAFGGMITDEVQPYIEGANSNASGVAVALELARALAENPLPSHDVVFIFTGAAESLNAGIEAFITQYAPPQAESRWIVLDSVGVGTPVYVQRGGLSLLTTTRPGAHSAAAAAETARKRPELRINGCAITTVDESARLRAHGYDAVRIAAIDSTGQVPNWNRTDDTTSALNPDTLYRAAAYTRALIGTLTDARENAPA